MAEIQIESARYIFAQAELERAKPQPQQESVAKLMMAASKIAHDVSPYLYATHQQIRHGGEEDAAPIRIGRQTGGVEMKKIKTKRMRTLKTEVLNLLRVAGGQVRHTTAIEILSRELGRPVTIVAYIAALDSLGNKVIRVRGASAIAGIA
jgi:hypothetical protein